MQAHSLTPQSRVMTAPRSRLLAYAQLLRVPNLFTAIADPLAGWLVVGGSAPAAKLLLLVGTSAGLYTAGIVFNDCFDYALDRRERPERPLPRGDIPRRTAWILACALMLAGLACAALAGPTTLVTAAFLAGLIFFYNAWAKRFTLLGPLALGACRFANFLIGTQSVPARLLWMPALLAAYVAGLTFIARHEATQPALRLIVKRLLLGIIVLDAAFVALTGDWVGAALVLSLLVPAVALGKHLAMT